VFGAVSSIPGLRVFPRLDPPLPNAGQYDVELVIQGDGPIEQMRGLAQEVIEAGQRSGRFLYVETDLQIDLQQASVVIDRERLADLGLDLAGVGRELGTLLGGAYVNRFNFFDRKLQGDPAARRRRARVRRPTARFEGEDAARRARSGVDVHVDRDRRRARAR
jgi:multidrug efflux pump